MTCRSRWLARRAVVNGGRHLAAEAGRSTQRSQASAAPRHWAEGHRPAATLARCDRPIVRERRRTARLAGDLVQGPRSAFDGEREAEQLWRSWRVAPGQGGQKLIGPNQPPRDDLEAPEPRIERDARPKARLVVGPRALPNYLLTAQVPTGDDSCASLLGDLPLQRLLRRLTGLERAAGKVPFRDRLVPMYKDTWKRE